MRRTTSSFLVLILSGLAHAQTVDLTEAALVDSHVRVALTMDLKGKITVQQNGEAVTFAQSAQAQHEYLERVLETKDGSILKAARFYQSGQVAINVEGEASKRKLNDKHATVLLLRKRPDEKPRVLSKNMFTREELEMTEHFDTLAVSGLAPGKEVKVGDSWSVAKPVVQALCGFDALGKHDLTCTLKESNVTYARVSIVGSAQGIDVGADVNLLIEGSYEFDLKEKRITKLTWKQTEERKASPVNPKIAATVEITVRRTPVEPAPELHKFALVPLPDGARPEHYKIAYRDSQGRFEFQHGRDWFVTSPPDNPQLVLRLLDDRGAYLAQATVTPMKQRGPAAPLKQLTEFAADMAATPGWVEAKEIERKGDVGHPQQYTVYRVTAAGQHLGVECIQSFLYLTSPQGNQLMVTFSLQPNQVANLNGRDEELIRSIVFPKQ